MERINRIWITWENHRRTRELVFSLPGIKLRLLQFKGPRAIRYPYLLLKTLMAILKSFPAMVFVQNPSVVLSLFMVTFGRFFVHSIVVDAHNEGLKPFYNRLSWLLPIYRLIQRRAHLTIVTNEELALEVKRNGGKPFVLPDRIPEFPQMGRLPLKGNFNIVYICTFEKDEPYSEVIQASRLLDSSTVIYMTGNNQKAPRKLIKGAPNNVIFTGFLSERDYLSLLFSCDIIMDLTLMENCLVCGGYEAVAVGKPLILSNTRTLRQYFSRGAIFTENDAGSIASTIRKSVWSIEKLEKEVEILRNMLRADWEKKKENLTYLLESLSCN